MLPRDSGEVFRTARVSSDALPSAPGYACSSDESESAPVSRSTRWKPRVAARISGILRLRGVQDATTQKEEEFASCNAAVSGFVSPASRCAAVVAFRPRECCRDAVVLPKRNASRRCKGRRPVPYRRCARYKIRERILHVWSPSGRSRVEHSSPALESGLWCVASVRSSRRCVREGTS